jgi:hypothetical protein
MTGMNETHPKLMTNDELKAAALNVAERLRAAGDTSRAASGGGSRQRALPEDLRLAFIGVRANLYERGIYDPVLVRFDTASAPQAETSAIAEELAKVAEGL